MRKIIVLLLSLSSLKTFAGQTQKANSDMANSICNDTTLTYELLILDTNDRIALNATSIKILAKKNLEDDIQTESNKDGLVKLTRLQSNQTYEIEITRIGYLPKKIAIIPVNEPGLQIIEMVKDYKNMEEVVITNIKCHRGCRTRRGCGTLVKTEIEYQIIDQTASPSFSVYPNPLPTGSNLTIAFQKNIPEKIEIISSAGQMIASKVQDVSKHGTTCTINIPANISAGVYFVRLISNSKVLKTAKFVVTS